MDYEEDNYPFSGESSRDFSLQQGSSKSDDFSLARRKEKCPVCSLNVHSMNEYSACFLCKRWVHQECDRTESFEMDYSCPSCRKLPLMRDAMLTASSPSPCSPLTTSQHDGQFDSYSARSSSPHGDSLDFSYSMNVGGQEELRRASSISSTESARNSPAFLPDNSPSDDGDDFRLFNRSSYSGRGGRGGKKKPGGRGASVRTRSGGQPPSGVFLDRLGKRGRGKGRGLGKGGAVSLGSTRGRRPRGSFNSLMTCVASCSSMTSLSREVEEAATEDQENRLSIRSEQYVRTAVVCSEADMFLAHANLCLVCGSVGVGKEESMVACSTCAHTYHTYCVNLHDKVIRRTMNEVVITRGWRCLDCTVCEVCGLGKDEEKLILCEECDVAYHIYCLNPALERMQSPWRCHSCSKCRRCSTRVSSSNDLSKEGLCQPCHSLRKCPKCFKLYILGEPIIRCSSCMRWSHGRCEELYSEEQLENAAANRMRCSSCRPNSKACLTSNDHSNVVLCDNVALSRNAEEILLSKWMPSLLRVGSDLPASLLDLRSSSVDSLLGGSMGGSIDDDGMLEELELLSASLNMSGAGSRGGRGGGRGGGGPGRGRMAKLGVGGFFVKIPRHRLLAAEEEEDVGPDGKKKRMRKPRKSQLEDAYPAVIQEGFFGMRAVEGKNLVDTPLEEPLLEEYEKKKEKEDPFLAGDQLSKEAAEALRNDINESGILEDVNLNDYMNIDDVNFDFFDDDEDEFTDNMISDAYDVIGRDGFGEASQDSDAGNSSLPPGEASSQSAGTEESAAVVSVASAAIGGASAAADGASAAVGGAPPTGGVSAPAHPAHQLLHPQHLQPVGGGTLQPGMQRANLSQGSEADSMRPGERAQSGMSSSRSNSQMGGNAEGIEGKTVANAATERWEEDEPLGEKATKAAVLYVNVNHSSLKEQYPDWSERVKQIHRIWRSLSADRRQEYVNRARANRANREKPMRPPRQTRQPGMLGMMGGAGVGGASSGAESLGMPVGGSNSPLFSSLSSLPSGLMGHDMSGTTIGSTASCSMMSSGPAREFKVPMIPGGGSSTSGALGFPAGSAALPAGVVNLQSTPNSMQPGGSFSCNPQMTTGHLSSDVQLQYQMLSRQTTDLITKQTACEMDLSRMRKQKKNYATKRRQLQKSAGLDEEGKPLVVELAESDKIQLATINESIPLRQKELDSYKKEMKAHLTQKFSFEQKFRIHNGDTVNSLTGMMPDGLPPTFSSSSSMSLAASSSSASSAPSTTRPPSGGAVASSPMRTFQQLVLPHNMPLSQSAMTEEMVEMKSNISLLPQSKGRGRWTGHAPKPSPYLASGTIRYDLLKTLHDKDIYECVDSMLERVSTELEGVTLKRLLDTTYDSEMPKPKKKRQMQKKQLPVGPTAAAVNEVDAAFERIKQSLAFCQAIPKKSLEPRPRNEPAAFAVLGLSTMDDRDQRSSIVQSVSVGGVELRFLEDVYSLPLGRLSLPDPVSMAAIAPLARLALLAEQSTPQWTLLKGEANPSTSSPERRADKEDSNSAPMGSALSTSGMSNPPWHYGDSFRGLLSSFERRRPLLRSFSRLPELPRPADPLRTTFYKPKVEEEKDVEVTLELFAEAVGVKFEPKERRGISYTDEGITVHERAQQEIAAERFLAQLQLLLGLERPILEYHLDTPPQSPKEAIAPPNADVPSLPTPSVVEIKKEMVQVHEKERETENLGERVNCFTTHRRNGGKCRLCEGEVFENGAVRQTLSQLGLTPSDDGEEEVTFCTPKCYYIFVAASSVPLSPEQLAKAEAHCDEVTYSKLKQISADSFARCIQQGKMVKWDSLSGEALLTSPRDTRWYMQDESGRRDYIHVIRVSELGVLSEEAAKREKARSVSRLEWQVYSQPLLDSFLNIHKHKQELASRAKLGVDRFRLAAAFHDDRVCVLCLQAGDGDPAGCGRLLSVDAGVWVHVNCALWSSEVYETSAGALINVDNAIVRAASMQCHVCGLRGATVQCFKTDCLKSFHLHCAARIGGKFLKDKTYMCSLHSDIHSEYIISLEALRRLFIQRDENALLSKLFDITEGPRLVLRLGALAFHRLGQLLPEQLKSCHNSRYIYPIGYTVSRLFWSPVHSHRRVRYSLTITEKDGRPLFSVSPPDGPAHSAATPTEAWKDIVEGVARLRERTTQLKMFPSKVEGETLFGLNEPTITKMTESLPGVEALFTYSFRHGGSAVMELPLAENPSGCARCEPRMRTLIKHMKSVPSSGRMGIASYSGGGPSSLLSQMEYLMAASARWDQYGAMEQSYSAYQKMKKEWRQTVYLARSKIQGLGLYAKRDIDMGAMIIEYKGEVIRGEVGEMRERRYFAQNRGTYMFRIDDEVIIDATMAGGPARYINHSCDPNCATHIMPGATPRDKKIIITANRPIKAGEEVTCNLKDLSRELSLTYDYQFDVEETTEKLACLCGAPNCQRWMN